MKRLTLCFALAAAIGSAAPAQRKLSNELVSADRNSVVPMIVQWNSDVSDEKDQKVSIRGGSLLRRFKAVRAGLYLLTPGAAADLANDPDVAFISPDRPIHSKLDNTAAAVNAAAAWSAGYNGTGIGVAVLDSGMNADANLGAGRQPVYSYDFTSSSSSGSAPSGGLFGPLSAASALTTAVAPLAAAVPVGVSAPDQYGHGQHIAGIIAANGHGMPCPNCIRSFVGIAPGVNLINFRVLDQNGAGTDSAVISALEAAINLKSALNIRVINLSLGRPVFETYTQDPLCQAVEAAWKAGIVVVVAAGNDGRDNSVGEQGYGTVTAPGNDPYVITVGAMKTEGTFSRTDDLVASYSSKGPTQVDHFVKPDVVAPGNLIVSLLVSGSTLQSEYPANGVPLSYYESPVPPGQANKLSPNYFILNGTSMATGVVSGAAADLLTANPNLTPDQVKILLMQSAYKTFPSSSTVTDSTGTYVDYYDLFTIGAGYIDLAAALANVNKVPSGVTGLSPVANYNAANGSVTLSFDSSAVWGMQTAAGTYTMWSAPAAWGPALLPGLQVAFASQTVWGATNPSAAQNSWGASAVWSSSSVWSADAGSQGSRCTWGASTAANDNGGKSNSVQFTGEQ